MRRVISSSPTLINFVFILIVRQNLILLFAWFVRKQKGGNVSPANQIRPFSQGSIVFSSASRDMSQLPKLSLNDIINFDNVKAATSSQNRYISYPSSNN